LGGVVPMPEEVHDAIADIFPKFEGISAAV
jgi:hypothetical protein